MRKVKQTSSNYDYFVKTDTSKYEGEWIAIANQQVVAHGKDAQEVYLQAIKKAKTEDVSLAKVPTEQMMVLVLTND